MSTVTLVFPPLVESSFGSIYPSTPVLAAHLATHGISVEQVDLNAAFLDFMLGDAELRAAGEGRYRRCWSASRAAAHWTKTQVEKGTLDAADFTALVAGNRSPLANVRVLLAHPYSVSPDSSVLDGRFEDSVLIDAYERFFAAEVDVILRSAPADAIVGISVPMGPQLLPALVLGRILREASGERTIRIVLGGPAISLLAEHDIDRLLRHHPALDCIVRFDGEGPILALARQVERGEWAPQLVAGTSSRSVGRTRHTPPEPGPRLDTLPTPWYPESLLADAAHGSLGVIQARGCYWGKCDYCDFVEVYKGSPPYRGRKAELVLQDIEQLIARTGRRRFRIITESIPPAFARRFSQLLLERELDVSWNSFVMVDRRFDAELLRQMARSGCEYLVVGLESMVTRVLSVVHKSADREENIRFLTEARDAGIRLSINLIPDLPTTTKDEAEQSLRDVAALADCFENVKVFPFEPTRSSRIGRSPSSFGFVVSDEAVRASHAQFLFNTLQVDDPAMSPDERAEVHRTYAAFAVQMNARSHWAGELANDRSYVDVTKTARGLQVTNLATLEQFEFPALSVGADAGRTIGPASLVT